MFAACLDMGGAYAGAMIGSMNTASQVGSFTSSLAFGYIVGHFGSYEPPFHSHGGIPRNRCLVVAPDRPRRAVESERPAQAPPTSAGRAQA